VVEVVIKKDMVSRYAGSAWERYECRVAVPSTTVICSGSMLPTDKCQVNVPVVEKVVGKSDFAATD
jgi:hypothetical protein